MEHGLSPYTHAPLDVPFDPVYPFAGSKDAVSVYGPAFTLLTYPLAPLGVPAAFWILKAVAAGASLGIVALIWRACRLLGRDPVAPSLLVGLNPHALVHVVGGAHNEALVMLLATGGVVLFLERRERAAPAVATAAAGLKASAALVVPFLVLGARAGGGRVRAAGRAMAAAALAGLAIASIHALSATDAIHSRRPGASAASGSSHRAYQGTSQADATSTASVVQPAAATGSILARQVRTSSHSVTPAKATA